MVKSASKVDIKKMLYQQRMVLLNLRYRHAMTLMELEDILPDACGGLQKVYTETRELIDAGLVKSKTEYSLRITRRCSASRIKGSWLLIEFGR
jgi:hypothetical protein